MRFEAVLAQWETHEMSQAEAARVLGVTERTFRRWCQRYEEDGLEGLLDRRIGKPSPKRVPLEWIARVAELYIERYRDFNAKHFHEHLVAEHNFPWSYTWTKTLLHQRQLLPVAASTGVHRKKRPRRPQPGLMLHQDGSPHRWIPALDRSFDLIVTMDDATSEIYSAFLVEEEGTMSSFAGLRAVIAKHGLFCSLYSDRGGHYFTTPEAGGKVDEDNLTQVGRALAQLGIEHIPAYSPEARGRSERMFGTLQERLPKELRLAGITTLEVANRFIAEVYLPRHNARFAVPASAPGSAFVPDPAGHWRDILCVQEERVVGNDNTVRYRKLSLQAAAEPVAAPLRQGQGARPSLPRRDLGHLPRAAPAGSLWRRRPALAGGIRRSCASPGRLNRFGARRPVDMWTIRSADRLRFPRVHLKKANTGKCSPSPTSPQGQPPHDSDS